MWELPDVFAGDAFTALTLTAKINNVPYTPQLLGSIGLFQVDGTRTTDIAVGERNGTLSVVATSERGAPPAEMDNSKQKIRKSTASHIAIEAYVNADEAQDALADATVNGQPPLQAAEGLLDDRLNGPFGLRARIELTHEYHRLGGIKGIVLDKDGTTQLYNWFTFFGISPIADQNTNFGALTVDDGTFEKQLAGLKRLILQELEGLPVAAMRPLVLAGDNYFDLVYSNKEVKAARKTRDTGRESDVFGENKAYSTISYGGFDFVNYRGTKDGAVGINTDEARIVPYNVPGLFQMLFAPPDIMGLTNTKGLPVHSFMPPEKQTSRRACVEAQSNPLTFCARPRSLIRLTHT